MVLDSLGSWSIDKLDILAEYAYRYSLVMRGQKVGKDGKKGWLRAYHYIDAFAGAGIARAKEDPEIQRYVFGSAVRALEIDPQFDHLWFIDRKATRAAILGRTLIERGADPTRYNIVIGDANKKIVELVAELKSDERALVFLDPYGLQVEWRTIEFLATSSKVDLLINFSLMGVTRNLKRNGGPNAVFRRVLAQVMKSTDWIDELYARQAIFQQDVIQVRSELTAEFVAAHYEADLREIFASVSEPAIMTNSRGGPIYALIFASQDERAAKRIMDGVVSKYKRTRQERRPNKGGTVVPGEQGALDGFGGSSN